LIPKKQNLKNLTYMLNVKNSFGGIVANSKKLSKPIFVRNGFLNS
jgi:hypothetical protein